MADQGTSNRRGKGTLRVSPTGINSSAESYFSVTLSSSPETHNGDVVRRGLSSPLTRVFPLAFPDGADSYITLTLPEGPDDQENGHTLGTPSFTLFLPVPDR